MTDEPRTDLRNVAPDSEGYEPPRVEDLPSEDDTVAAAAMVAKSPPPPGPEWRA